MIYWQNGAFSIFLLYGNRNKDAPKHNKFLNSRKRYAIPHFSQRLCRWVFPGSGQSITIKYNADLRPGIYGRTTAANPYVIEIGSDALVSEEELANTIAHELNHARDFIRGGIAPESSAYSSGNALSDYIMGGR